MHLHYDFSKSGTERRNMNHIEKTSRQALTYSPPNSCMPRRAKTMMNKKRRNRRLRMDLILLNNEMTRFLRDDQYL